MDIVLAIFTLLMVFMSVVLVVLWILARTRRVVPPNKVDFVVDASGEHMYSSNTDYNPEGKTIYHEFPEWVWLIGKTVTRVDLEILEIEVDNITLYDKDKAKFDCNLRAYLIADDIKKIVTRRPRDIRVVEDQLRDILEANARGVSTTKSLQEIMIDRDGLVRDLTPLIRNTVANWGYKLNNTELLRFLDTPGTHNVSNLALQRQSEIDRSTREIVAENKKQATITEAESQEEAEIRVINMEEKVNVADQLKEKAILEAEEKAIEQSIEVERAEHVGRETYQKDVKRLSGEGDKLKAQELADAEAAPILKKGKANADARQAMLDAEAKGKGNIQKAVEKFTPLQRDVMVAELLVDKDKAVYVEAAKAYQNADIRVFAGGSDGDNKGFSLAQLMQTIRTGDDVTAKALLNRIARPNDLGFGSWDELIQAIDNPDTITALKKAISKANK